MTGLKQWVVVKASPPAPFLPLFEACGAVFSPPQAGEYLWSVERPAAAVAVPALPYAARPAGDVVGQALPRAG